MKAVVRSFSPDNTQDHKYKITNGSQLTFPNIFEAQPMTKINTIALISTLGQLRLTQHLNARSTPQLHDGKPDSTSAIAPKTLMH